MLSKEVLLKLSIISVDFNYLTLSLQLAILSLQLS